MYSDNEGLFDSSQCSICPRGFYCHGGGANVSGICEPGFYCPDKTAFQENFPCPAGKHSSAYGLFDFSQCLDCAPGKYCTRGSVNETQCPRGTYSGFYRTESAGPGDFPACTLCDEGHYCIEGSISPIPCGIGKYSPAGEDKCFECHQGHYCASNATSYNAMITGGGFWDKIIDLAGVCFNGTYCLSGMSKVPDLTLDACPEAHYCPSGTWDPIPCPAGRYSNIKGLDRVSKCLVTPKGSFSLVKSTEPTGECEPGFYCPEESSSATQVACPEGYYRTLYGAGSSADCSLCISGNYCPIASAAPLGCPPGHYCIEGSSEPEPCPPGSYAPESGSRSTHDCKLCDGGYFCDTFGATTVSGLCSPGFFCIQGSKSSTPNYLGEYFNGSWNASIFQSNFTALFNSICPTGHYCPMGTSLPLACPAGTYNNLYGADSIHACLECPDGNYCAGMGNEMPTGLCSEGSTIRLHLFIKISNKVLSYEQDIIVITAQVYQHKTHRFQDIFLT